MAEPMSSANIPDKLVTRNVVSLRAHNNSRLNVGHAFQNSFCNILVSKNISSFNQNVHSMHSYQFYSYGVCLHHVGSNVKNSQVCQIITVWTVGNEREIGILLSTLYASTHTYKYTIFKNN